jgi:hypothetical protein
MAMNKQLRKIFKEFAKGHHAHARTPWVHSSINDRARLLKQIQANTEDGMIAVYRSGMDCDCTQYSRCSIIPAPKGAFIEQYHEDQHQQWLDGPESSWYGKPSQAEPHYKSADRALEAYEEGHPHLILWGDL